MIDLDSLDHGIGRVVSVFGISYRKNRKPSLQIQYLLQNTLDSRRHHFEILCLEVLNEMYNDKVLFDADYSVCCACYWRAEESRWAVERGERNSGFMFSSEWFLRFKVLCFLLGAIHKWRHPLHGLMFYTSHFFSSKSSWTPKTQPNDSRAAVWLSFWCSTRPSADTGTD